MGQAAAKIPAPSVSANAAHADVHGPGPAVESPSATPSFSGGSALRPSTRARMESAFGRSFDGVRVHTDANAASFARTHQAEAVTSGENIAFGSSKYNPDTESGDKLIAHELAHVTQGGGSSLGAVQAKSDVSTSNEPAEMQADAAASRVMAGQPAGIAEGSLAWTTRGRLMRKAIAGASAPTLSVPVPVPDLAVDTTTEAPPNKRKNREVVENRGVEASKEQREADVLPEGTVDEASAERPSLLGRDERRPVDAATSEKRMNGRHPRGAPVRRDGLAGRIAAQSLRAVESATADKPADKPNAIEGGKEPGIVRDKQLNVAGAVAGAKADAKADAKDVGSVGAAQSKEAAAAGAKVPGPGGAAQAKDGRAAGAKVAGTSASTSTSDVGPLEEATAGDKPKRLVKGKELGSSDAQKSSPDAGKKVSESSSNAPAVAEAMTKAPTVGPGGKSQGVRKDAPVGGAPAGASHEPAVGRGAAPTAAGGGGGGGGDGGGGDGGGAAPEAEAVEEKMDERQPEEEKAAEAQQDGEGAAGGGEGGEAGEQSEAEAEPAAVGGETEEPSPAGDAEPAPPEVAEKQLEAKQAPAIAEAEEQAAEEKQVEAEQEQAEQQGPQEANPEEAQLAPAERDAAMASVGEDAGGGGGGDGGGGGGGGGAVPDKEVPPAPDVSGQPPGPALGALKGQSPLAVKNALGGVSKSVSTSVADKQNAVADNPPGRPISTGMPGKVGQTEVAEGGGETTEKPEEVPEGETVETPEPEPVPEPGPAAVDAVSTPATSGDDSGQMSQADAENMGSAISNMPTTDPEVDTSAGPAPKLALEGNADPAQMTAQRVEMDAKLQEAHNKGKVDAQKPLGEDEIAPRESNETATAKISNRAGGQGGASGGGGGTPDEETASIVAQEKSPGEVDAALEKGEGDVATEEQKHEEQVAAEEQKTEQETDQAEVDAESEQVAKKAAAKNKISNTRAAWSEDQQKTVTDAQTEAEKQQTEGEEKIQTGKKTAEEKAEGEIDAGEREAKAKKSEKETEAKDAKRKGEEKSSGFFGWLASKAKALFNEIKEAIKSIISALRTLVKEIIEARRRAALQEIENERQRAVDEIHARRDKMLAEADAALADFPELREKRRAEILAEAQAAEDEVNNRAEKLKKETNEKYDALAAAADKAFDLLEKGLMMIVDAVASAVNDIIKKAEAVAKALGGFMALIKDVASNPGQWIANLGAAVVDGIKNHLVKALKSAISGWFKSKVEEVLGIPIDLMKALFKGGINLAAIGKMAWEALKSAIPTILIQLLIEKLVAMVVPAAGAVMAIIEGLQAAWGTVSRIIAAIDLFITFLKAVKGGGAGPQFAAAVAAAGVVVIDFVANWLLLKLMKPAKKVASKLGAIAKKILAKVKKAFKKIGKKLKKAFKKLGKGLKKLFKGKKKKGKGKGKDKKGDKDRKKKERIEKAMRDVPPKVRALVAKKPRKLMLKLQLLNLRLQYRLKKLTVNGTRPNYTVSGFINPPLPEEKIFGVDASKFLAAVQKLARRWAAKRKSEGRNKEDDSLKSMPDHNIEARTHGKDGVKDVGTAGGQSVQFLTDKSLTRSVGTGEAPSYLQFSNTLKKLSAEDQKAFGEAMAQLVKNKKADKNFVNLGELYGTMFASERKRHSKNYVYALMAVQTIATQGGAGDFLSPKTGAGGGTFAPGFPGALQGQAGVSAHVKDQQHGFDKFVTNQRERQKAWEQKNQKPIDKAPPHLKADPEATGNEAYRREVEQIRRWAVAAGIEDKLSTNELTIDELVTIIEKAISGFYVKGG